jgi:mitogen-activated protein kinase kinase 3
VSQFGFRFKHKGIKVNQDGVVNENTGDTYGFINPEEIIIKEQIGYGTGGSVHLAIHEPSDTKLAIKNVNIYDRDKRHQLMNELNSLKEGLQWESLVQFYGAYYDEGRVKLVLEYMDWGSLRSFMDVIKEQVPDQTTLMPEYVIGKSTYQLLRALNFLHKQRHQVHRDVKPENVLVNSFGEFKLTDFGISKQLLSTINICKSFVGTIAYMSPERMNSEEYSYLSDVWSLGLIVYEMATGQHWYPECRSFIEMRETILSNSVPQLPDDGRFSEEMIDFVDQWLQINPKDRASTSDLLLHPWILKYAEIESEVIQWVKEVNDFKEQIYHDKRVSKEDIEMLGLQDFIGLKEG